LYSVGKYGRLYLLKFQTNDIEMVDIPDEMQAELPRSSSGFSARHFYKIFRDILYEIVKEQQPMTVRQVFYRAVVKGYVGKTDKGYGCVQRDLADMRWKKELPYEWIIDSSRNSRGSQGYNNELEKWLEQKIDDLPNSVASWWFRDLLADHEFSIQVWLEKEALAEIVWSICRRWHVPLYPARGYASLTFINKAAKDLELKDRPAKIFQLGDYDPSGQDAIQIVRYQLRGLAPLTARHGIEFHNVALTLDQIRDMNLPTRPTKQSDPRSGSFGDESVELDAIEPDVLRQMVDDTLSGCFPIGAREKLEEQVEQEQEIIRNRVREMLKDESV
jgi:hypothetical protein